MASSHRLAANVFSGVVSNVIRIGVQVLMLPLMARLLGPAEIGLYALALPIISFVLLLSDAGLGDSLAREKSDNSLVWSSAFWGLIGSGTILAIVVYGASFIIADISKQPRLPEIMLPLSTILLLVAATVIPNALMLRHGNLVPSAIGDIVGNVLGAALGIILALMGFGVWAMVAQYMSSYFVRAVVFNIARPFVPKFEFSLSSLFSHTGMGSQILGTRLMELVTRMFESSQVSRRLGAAALGGYSYAFQIGQFTSNTFGNPLWANLYYYAINKTPAETVAHYVRSHRILALFVFPTAALLAMAMPTLIPFLLGPKWTLSIAPIMVMILAGPFGNMAAFQSAVLFARNQGHFFVYGLVGVLVARVILVLMAWPFGIFGLCIGQALITLGYFLFSVLFIAPIIDVKRTALIRAILGPLAASIVAGVSFHFMVRGETTLIWLVAVGVAAFLIYAIVLFAVDYRRVREDLTAITEMLRHKSIKI